MASRAIGLPEGALRAQGGSIGIGHNLNRGLTYGQLIGEQQIELTTNPKVAVVNPSDYQVVGQPTARVDLPAKFLAQFEYVHNVVVPGMLHARVVRPSGTTADGNPVALRNATLDSVDSTRAEAVPGYVRTVQKDNFVAVVATDEWAAIQAAAALAVTWRTGAPLDPRVRWLTGPSGQDSEAAWTWARVNMMLGAARVRRERLHLADTWTFITVACFLLWTVAVLLGA